MSQSQDLLHAGLTHLAEGVGSVDLYERALRRARQIGRQRGAWIVVGLATSLVVAGAALTQTLPRGSDTATLSGAEPTSASSVTTAPSTSPTPTPAVVAGVDLRDVTVTLPPFAETEGVGPCPTENIRIVDGSYVVPDGSVTIYLNKAVATDLDRDGKPELIGFFICSGPVEGGVSQTVAFKVTSAATLRPMGQVLGPVEGVGDDSTGIRDIEPAEGAVRTQAG